MYRSIQHFQKVMTTAQETPVLFGTLWIGLFLISFAILFQFGFVPSALSGETEEEEQELSLFDETPNVFAAETTRAAVSSNENDEPVRIIIDAVGIDVAIENPASQDIAVLDEALTRGAVRYPGSGDLEDVSNLFLFGHSSYLPNVINKAYTAFNDVKELEAGDIIRVQSKTKEYVYAVDVVELVDANNTWVELSSTEKKLTLSTCNTFGRKQDRYVVTARFVGSYELEASSLTF